MKTETTRLPDEDVIVKMVMCKQCNGFVIVSVKHEMTLKDRNEMQRTAFKYNLEFKEVPLLEYRKNFPDICNCIHD